MLSYVSQALGLNTVEMKPYMTVTALNDPILASLVGDRAVQFMTQYAKFAVTSACFYLNYAYFRLDFNCSLICSFRGGM